MSYSEFKLSETNPYILAYVFNGFYERSNDGEKQVEERGNAAMKWYYYFEGKN